MTTPPGRRIAIACATAISVSLLIAACSAGGSSTPSSADATAAAGTSATSGEAGASAKPSEGPKPGEFAARSQCAIESGPWVLNTTATSESIAEFYANQGVDVVGTSITGVYTADFARDGKLTIRTSGISTQAVFAQPDGETVYTDGYLAGEGVTQWAEASGIDDGSVITFASWASGLEWAGDNWSRDFTTLEGLPSQTPLWDITYSTANFSLECAPDELVLQILTDSPHITLVFAPQA